jgi:cytoskeletal protein CcmA (bactofilin family)
MPIFRRDNEGAPPPAAASGGEARSRSEGRGRATLIAAGTHVHGEITGDAELHIEGDVEGEIRVDDTVVVGASGRVKGQITARAVRVGGKVTGNVRGLERVEVLPSGSTEGDISAPRVVIAEGAFFKGKVEMNSGSGKGTT